MALDILQVQAEPDSRIRSDFGSPSAVRREATAMRMGLKFVFSGGRSATRQVKVIGRRLFPTDVSCGVSSVKSSNPVLGAGSGWGQHWHQQLRSILGLVEEKLASELPHYNMKGHHWGGVPMPLNMELRG